MIILLTIDILKSTFLKFCGTYFSSQRGGLDVLFTTPSMDDLILVSNDHGNDHGDDGDDKDGEVDLHVDVGGYSQFLDENIPSGDDPLTIEVAMNRSVTNHLAIVKVIAKECQLGGQIFCDHTMAIMAIRH
jgi:hypothetical protein